MESQRTMGVGQADDPGRRWHGRPLQVAGSAVARSTTTVARGGRRMPRAPRGESGSTGAGGTPALDGGKAGRGRRWRVAEVARRGGQHRATARRGAWRWARAGAAKGRGPSAGRAAWARAAVAAELGYSRAREGEEERKGAGPIYIKGSAPFTLTPSSAPRSTAPSSLPGPPGAQRH